MAKTPSTMLELGVSAPNFDLLEPATGKKVSLTEVSGGQGLAVLFICNHCPYVINLRDKLAEVGTTYKAKGIHFVAINSNDVENYPNDSPEKMIDEVKLAQYTFPYLYDADQSVAKAYMAACTPDLYLFDGDNKLYYRGQFDDSRPNSGEVNGADLCHAMDNLLQSQPAPTEQKPSLGCNIKWKAGNAPDYFG